MTKPSSRDAPGGSVSIVVDGVTLEAPADGTLMAALDRAGRLGDDPLVPHLCWHPSLSVAASCRLCRVEVEGAPELVAACTLPVREGMVVRTDGERVRTARRRVLELLLARHALDCPVCDASGECALQRDVFAHGPARARRREAAPEAARRVAIGSGLVLDRARCVHCERCVRFCDEVTGTRELVFSGRGDSLAIACAPGRQVEGGYAQNLVDVCPVGAITQADARPRFRPWALRSTPGVCGGCARGCNVWVDVAGDHVVRYRPRRNDAVNRSWLCDMGRRSCVDAERPDRLRRASLRDDDGRFVEVSIEEAIEEAAGRIAELVDEKGAGVLAALASPHATNEDLFTFRRFLGAMGTDHAAVVVPTGEGDDLLLRPERAANARGAEALGFGTPGRVLDRLRGGGLDALIVMGHDALGDAAIRDPSIFDRVDTLILLDTVPSVLVRHAHVTVPALHLLEKCGTVTNADGRVQRIERARTPAFVALSEGEFVHRLARALGLDGFAGAWDPDAVSREMSEAVPAFAGCHREAVGAAGRPLAAARPGRSGG